MSKLFPLLCASLCTLSSTPSFADAIDFSSSEPFFADSAHEASSIEPFSFSAQEVAPPSFIEQKAVVIQQKQAKPEAPFKAFTGKVKGRKVRLRLRPDLDSRIIKELNKNEMVAIVGEKGDFWAVQPPAGTKAFVFRGFVFDNVVEGNRVNIRLEPGTDAPVIGHLNAGDRIEGGVIAASNNKWLEITAPADTHFYIAKEFIDYAGGPELKVQIDKRIASAEQLLDKTTLLSKTEMHKPFDEIDFDRIVGGFNTVINDYAEFSDLAEHAREALAAFQETYLQARIAYLESKPDFYEPSPEAIAAEKAQLPESIRQITDRMKIWEPVEEALYLSWTMMNDSRDQKEFYEEQEMLATALTGILEPYNSPVKSKPGDFILKENDIPVAYVYSTKVNLQSLVGKKVTVHGSPRPNNNFAFPAYYVINVE